MNHRKIPSAGNPAWQPEGRDAVIDQVCRDVMDSETQFLVAQANAFGPRDFGVVAARRLLAALGWILLDVMDEEGNIHGRGDGS